MKIYSNEKIQTDSMLKQSFFQLANDVFQINLEQWDKLGYWNNSYNAHCAVEKNKVISNVSTSDALLIIDGKAYRTKQIGTVMTISHARRSGYATALMEHVLKENKELDYLFLFANKHAATFYEQFGFERVQQQKFSIATSSIQFQQTEIKKLDFNDEKTRILIQDLLFHRLPVSTKLGVLQNEMIVLFHLVSYWKEHLYYLPDLQTLVIGQQNGDVFLLKDFISKQPILLKELLPSLNVKEGTIQLGFTPSSFDGVESMLVEDDFFYVKTQCDTPFPENYYFPDLARA